MKSIFSAISLMLLSVSAFASNGSGMNWFADRVVSSLIHGVIYGMIFKLFHNLGLVPSLVLGAAILGGAYWWYTKNRR